MKYDLEEEKKVRRRLEISIKKFMKSNNFIWEETFIQVYYQGFKFDNMFNLQICVVLFKIKL